MSSTWRRALDRTGVRLRTLRAIAILAGVAFVLSFGLNVIGKQQRTVSTTVFVARVLPGSTTGDVDASIADFITVIGLPIVRNPVSEQTGVPAGKLASLSVARIQTSSAVRVSYTSSDEAVARRVVEASAREALRTLAQQQVDGATGAADAARSAADDALQALTAFEQQLGVVDFGAEYERRRQDLLNLQAQAVTTPSAALSQLITQRSAEVDKLAAQVPAYNRLSDRLAQTREAVAAASKALTDAQGKLAAAGAASALTDPDVAVQGKVLPAVRSGLLTAIVLALLAFGLAVLEARVRARRAGALAAERSLNVYLPGRRLAGDVDEEAEPQPTDGDSTGGPHRPFDGAALEVEPSGFSPEASTEAATPFDGAAFEVESSGASPEASTASAPEVSAEAAPAAEPAPPPSDGPLPGLGASETADVIEDDDEELEALLDEEERELAALFDEEAPPSPATASAGPVDEPAATVGGGVPGDGRTIEAAGAASQRRKGKSKKRRGKRGTPRFVPAPEPLGEALDQRR